MPSSMPTDCVGRDCTDGLPGFATDTAPEAHDIDQLRLREIVNAGASLLLQGDCQPGQEQCARVCRQFLELDDGTGHVDTPAWSVQDTRKDAGGST